MLFTPSWIADCLILAILGLICAHTYYLHSSRRWMLLDPLNTFWAGILVCYVGQPITAGDILISWHSEAVFNKTLLATLFGLVAVVLGYESEAGARLGARAPRLPQRLRSGRLLLAAIVLLAVGALGYKYIIGASGGWTEWISVGRGGTDYERVQGYLPELAQGVPAGLFLLFACTRFFQTSSLLKAIGWCAAAVMLWWFFYLGSRSRLIMAAILVLSAYYLPRKKSPSFWVVAMLFLATLLATNTQEYYRENFRNLSFNLDQIESSEFWGRILPRPLGSGEFRRETVSPGLEFNCAMSVVELVPARVPYNYGYGFLEMFTRPIPRAVWPNKIYPHIESVQGVLREGGLSEAQASTVPAKELLMGPAFAFVGHWYYVGGFLALALGGYITGVVFRSIRSFYDSAPDSHSVMLVYPFLLSIGFAEAASTPWHWVYSLAFTLLPFIGIIYFSRERTAQPFELRRRSRPSRGRSLHR